MPNLVRFGKIVDNGLYAYWRAVDAAFEFNAKRHELFLAKKMCAPCEGSRAEDKLASARNEECSEDRHDVHLQDIPNFFKKHRQQDRYHWDRNHADRLNTGNRFLLPKIRRR